MEVAFITNWLKRVLKREKANYWLIKNIIAYQNVQFKQVQLCLYVTVTQLSRKTLLEKKVSESLQKLNGIVVKAFNNINNSKSYN